MSEIFDRNRLKIKSIKERISEISIDQLIPLDIKVNDFNDENSIIIIANLIKNIKNNGYKVLIFLGGHVIKECTQLHLIDLLNRGYIDHIATNGSVQIHDYEFVRFGVTSESVTNYIKTGEFGLWEETAEINDIIFKSYKLGLGKAIGQFILNSNYKYKDISIFSSAVRLNIPITVHIGIGYDIIHQHPNFDASKFGEASYIDFLSLCNTVENLNKGIVLTFGSSVMAPEILLKSLSMARNIKLQQKLNIDITSVVFDVKLINKNEIITINNPNYYNRDQKTLLNRIVSGPKNSFYICGKHSQTIPLLRKYLL